MKTGPRKFELTAEILLRAYSIGVFPMAESRDAKDLFWVEPQERGIFPLDGLVVSRSLAKTVRSDRYRVVADRAFEAVVRACAEREKTWINDEIVRLYGELFAAGHAHSVEAYEGTRWSAAFTGESARRLLRRKHVPSRQGRLEGCAGASVRAPSDRRIPVARRAILDRAPGEPRRVRFCARCSGSSWRQRSRSRRVWRLGASSRDERRRGASARLRRHGSCTETERRSSLRRER